MCNSSAVSVAGDVKSTTQDRGETSVNGRNQNKTVVAPSGAKSENLARRRRPFWVKFTPTQPPKNDDKLQVCWPLHHHWCPQSRRNPGINCSRCSNVHLPLYFPLHSYTDISLPSSFDLFFVDPSNNGLDCWSGTAVSL